MSSGALRRRALLCGAEMRWHNGLSLAGSFDGEFSGTTQSYAGKGTLRYVFN